MDVHAWLEKTENARGASDSRPSENAQKKHKTEAHGRHERSCVEYIPLEAEFAPQPFYRSHRRHVRREEEIVSSSSSDPSVSLSSDHSSSCSRASTQAFERRQRRKTRPDLYDVGSGARKRRATRKEPSTRKKKKKPKPKKISQDSSEDKRSGKAWGEAYSPVSVRQCTQRSSLIRECSSAV